MDVKNYFVTHWWMISELGLKGFERDIYAIIYGFSQDGVNWFYGTRSYLCEWTGANKSTISRCLQSLMDKGLIAKRVVMVDGKRRTEYKALQNATSNMSFVAKCDVTCCKMQPKELQNATHDNISNNIGDSIDIYSCHGGKLDGAKLDGGKPWYPFAMECLRAYNEIMGTTYINLPRGCESYLDRMGEHYTIGQVRDMLAYYRRKWSGDDKQRQYLNMQVLFGSKGFESYMQTAISAKDMPESFEDEQRRKNEEYIRELEQIQPAYVITNEREDR